MTAVLLLPVSALVVGVLATMWSLGRLGEQARELRRSLRNFNASAVAVAELDREATKVSERATATRTDAQFRLHRHRRARLGR